MRVVILFILLLVVSSAIGLAVSRDSVSLEIDGFSGEESSDEHVFAEGVVLLGLGEEVSSFEENMKIKSDYKDNEFYIGFPVNNSIDKGVSSSEDGFVETSFSDISLDRGNNLNYFLRLEYDGIDLINRERWSKGAYDLYIENVGSKNNPKIQFEVLK